MVDEYGPEPKDLTRRTVMKGAAWSVPVLAVAATAPMAAASAPPSCPTCFKPGFGAWTLDGVLGGYSQRLTFAAPVVLDATSCSLSIFQPAFTFIATKATLTMSDGSSYDTDVAFSPSAGVLGLAGAFAQAFSFPNVTVGQAPSLSHPLGVTYYPDTLTVTVNITLKYGLGLTLLCPWTLTWKLHPAISAVLPPLVVSYTGVSAAS